MLRKNFIVMRTKIALGILFILPFLVQGQDPITRIGTRTELGLYGGVANDLSVSSAGDRLFAAVDGPGTLYYSDDQAESWTPAFPVDLMSFYTKSGGWGGGAAKVLTNHRGWVLVKTNGLKDSFSEAVMSFNNGYAWQTAMNADKLFALIQEMREVSDIALTDSSIFVAMEDFLVQIPETSPQNPVVLPLSLPPGYSIRSLAVSNNPAGLPLYMVLQASTNDAIFTKYDGVNLITLAPPGNPDFIPENVFMHPGFSNDSILFASYKDINTDQYSLRKSLDHGQVWMDVMTLPPMPFPLKDADYFPSWEPLMPQSNGLRLAFPDGTISDDLGMTWQMPASPLYPYAIASSAVNPDIIFGSGQFFIRKSIAGIAGSFDRTSNYHFHNLAVYDIARSNHTLYVATSCGLAQTTKYDTGLPEDSLWQGTNGVFPVASLANEITTAVEINPSNPAEVICGGPFGFAYKPANAQNFTIVTPPDWNTGPNLDYTVTDIKFLNGGKIIATTGKKFIDLGFPAPPNVGNIWVSLNGGVSWTKQSNIPISDFHSGNIIFFDAPNNVVLIGSGIDEDGMTEAGALWKSVNNGDSWTHIFTPVSPLTGQNLPVFDIEASLIPPADYYLAAGEQLLTFSLSGNNFDEKNVPAHLGKITALLFENSPDTLRVGIGNNIANYLPLIDDADVPFAGYPQEHIYCLEHGSLLSGSSFGASKVTTATTYTLDLKIFFEGPFNSATQHMDTTLNAAGYLPLSQPFNQPPWNYTGTERVSAIPNADVVDWILVELRVTTGDASTATSDKAFDRQAGFLLKDGTLVDTDGSTPMRFSRIMSSGKDSQHAYAKLLEKRHTGGKTSSPLVIDNTSKTATYDYTTSAGNYYGDKSVAKELSTGIYGLVTGDADGDGYVNNVDKNDYWVPGNGNTGYYDSDFNMDGNVDATDLNYWKNNAGLGAGDL